MPRPHDAREGDKATFAERVVHYSPFVSDIQKSFVLVGDPWGYLRMTIQKKSGRYWTQGANYKDAEYFVNLASEYYQAASSLHSLTRALLYYYGYLNLAKAYLSLAGVKFGRLREHHGLSLHGPGRLEIQARSPNRVNVFPEFIFRLQGKNIQQQTINLVRPLRALPEVHEIGLVSGAFKQRDFIRVEVSLWQSGADHAVWYRVSYNKSDRPLITDLFSRFDSGRRRELLWQTPQDQRSVNFESRDTFPYTRSTREVYTDICGEVNSLPIYSLLTTQGYRHYVLLARWPFGQIGAAFMTMFWLASLVRYRPKLVREIMDSNNAPVLSEFLAINPDQFLYQMTNYITQTECVRPYSYL